MNYTIDTLWVLLEHLIDHIQNCCIDYDSQITFTREKASSFITLLDVLYVQLQYFMALGLRIKLKHILLNVL